MAGTAEQVAEGVRRVLAPNPSPLTFKGTNSYILGKGRVAVIDPGPANPDHMSALLGTLGLGEQVDAILVTHPHLDHSGLAHQLAKATGAPIYAAGRADEGRSAAMRALAATGLAGGGEGLDLEFLPDIRLADGQVLEGESWEVEVVATPGHLGTHLAFAMGESLFTGDHVMAWATTIVSPPDGDMGAYMASLDRLAERKARLLLPGHGPEIHDPAARIAELAAHRRARDAAVHAALGQRPQTAEVLARRIYTDTSPALLPAAARSVFAHLLYLSERGLAKPVGMPGADAGFVRS